MTTKPVPPPGQAKPAHPSQTPPGPNAGPDNLEPLPDAMFQLRDFTRTAEIIFTYFYDQHSTLVSGDTPVYYRDHRDKQRFFKPDCYVAFDVDQAAIYERNGYYIEEVGKPPDFALEIASVSTADNDTGFKRNLYARLGITEYWRFDATGGEYYSEALAGETLVDGAYRRIPLNETPDGKIWGHSELLGLDLWWDNKVLRFYDPAEGRFLLSLLESQSIINAQQDELIAQQNELIAQQDEVTVLEEGIQNKRAALAEANAERDAAATARAAAEAARTDAEIRLAAADIARAAAEARERLLLEELRRLYESSEPPEPEPPEPEPPEPET